MIDMDCVTIVSGGMDSVTLLHKLVNDGLSPIVLHFQYGQRHSRESACAVYNATLLNCPFVTIDISPTFAPIASIANSALINSKVAVPDWRDVDGDSQPVTYVPNRNAILLNVAASYAEAIGVNTVYYGAQAQDLYGYWDCTPDFVDCLNDMLALNRKHEVEIVAPFINMKKADILRLGVELGVDYANTWTCYNGGDSPCNTCPTCMERINAFSEVGIPDPLLQLEK